MENLVNNCFSKAFSGRKVLLTGHNGFKGSWLTLWLTQLGAKVYGISLAPDTEPSHWQLLNLPLPSEQDNLLDISQFANVKRIIDAVQPELVLHLAAQPLVRQSYHTPLTNWHTNVMGTVHVLEACRQQPSVKAILAVTTDKVYENPESGLPFNEDSPLGGHDPYSASKAACELVVQSYRRSFFSTPQSPLLATARAGNVIGGGDWAADRLIPDIVRASQSGQPVKLRYPQAVRPWQHVLDCLSGYLLLAAGMLQGNSALACSWNFGPPEADNQSVADVLRLMQQHWPLLNWETEPELRHWYEAGLLSLSTEKARAALQWQPVWNVAQAAAMTALWYQGFYQHNEILSQAQLAEYIRCARDKGLRWAIN